MSDRFEQFLNDLKDPSKYVRVPGVTIFDAHVEKDRNGKIIRKFGKKELEELARVNNRLAGQGDVPPLVYGHTDPEEKDESKQPAPRGYALNYQVAYDRLRSRWVLQADYFIRREEYARAKTYPFTSIELWTQDKTIHPVALLRRTPQRPIGAWTYARGDATAPLGIPCHYARLNNGPVLRYSMSHKWTSKGADMAKPNRYEMPPPEDEAPEMGGGLEGEEGADPGLEGAPSMEDHHAYQKHCAAHPLHSRITSHYAKHYGMAEEEPVVPEHDPTALPDALDEVPEQHGAFAAPSATNTFPEQNGKKPLAKTTSGPGLDRFSRGGDPQQYERRIAALELQNAEKEADNWLMQLASEFYEIDEDPEDGDRATLVRAYQKGGETACERYANKVRSTRKERIDRPIGRVPTEEGPKRASDKPVDLEREPELMPREDQFAVAAYQRTHQLWDMDLKDLAPLALPKKYGKAGASKNGTATRGRRDE